MNERLERFMSRFMLIAALAVCTWLGWKQVQLREESQTVEAELNKIRDNAAVATLNNLAIPSSRVLSVCNGTEAPLKINAVAAVYGGNRGDLKVFNSARQGWQTWTVPAHRKQPMQLNSSDGGWPGFALFYAMDVEEPGGTERMLAGTAEDLTGPCISLSKPKR
jgi:hypothetical protein